MKLYKFVTTFLQIKKKNKNKNEQILCEKKRQNKIINKY